LKFWNVLELGGCLEYIRAIAVQSRIRLLLELEDTINTSNTAVLFKQTNIVHLEIAFSFATQRAYVPYIIHKTITLATFK